MLKTRRKGDNELMEPLKWTINRIALSSSTHMRAGVCRQAADLVQVGVPTQDETT
jgi:hypothetical protein